MFLEDIVSYNRLHFPSVDSGDLDEMNTGHRMVRMMRTTTGVTCLPTELLMEVSVLNTLKETIGLIVRCQTGGVVPLPGGYLASCSFG